MSESDDVAAVSTVLATDELVEQKAAAAFNNAQQLRVELTRVSNARNDAIKSKRLLKPKDKRGDHSISEAKGAPFSRTTDADDGNGDDDDEENDDDVAASEQSESASLASEDPKEPTIIERRPLPKPRREYTVEDRRAAVAAAEAKLRPKSDAVKSSIALLKAAIKDAAVCEAAARKLGLEHGIALSVELHASCDLALMDLQYDLSELHVIMPDEAMRHDVFMRYGHAERRLNEAVRIANSYGDRGLLTRCLELLANIYNRTECYDDEIRVVEAAVQVDRTIPKVLALLDAYASRSAQLWRTGHFEVNVQEEQTDPEVKAQNEELLKCNYGYYIEYIWLKDQEEFNFEDWCRTHKNAAFRALIYTATIMSNALLTGNDESKHKEGLEAAREALWLAKLCKDGELTCIAEARFVQARWGRADDKGKRALIAHLEAVEMEYKPDNDELREQIETCKEQFRKLTSCQRCNAPNAEFKCSKCKLARYCSRECQKHGWPKHKETCIKLRKAREEHLAELRKKQEEEDKEYLKQEMLAKMQAAQQAASNGGGK